MKPQQKYRLGTATNNYWWFRPVYGAPTFILIFRRSLHNLVGFRLAWRSPSSSVCRQVFLKQRTIDVVESEPCYLI